MKLSTAEFNVLNKIATKSKMDCWFYIVEDKDNDVILDCETGEKRSLYNGINMLADDITSLDDYNLTTDEKLCFTTLMYKLEANNNAEQSKWKAFLINALTLISDICGDMYLIDELGMTEEDYYELTGEQYEGYMYLPDEEEDYIVEGEESE